MSAVNVLFSRNGLKQGRTKKHKKGEGARLSGGRMLSELSGQRDIEEEKKLFDDGCQK